MTDNYNGKLLVRLSITENFCMTDNTNWKVQISQETVMENCR